MVEEELHRGGTLGALVLRACRRFRDASAVVGPDLRLTYTQVSHRISGMMQAFDEAGLVRGDGVALLSSNSADVVVATCAVMAAGLRLTALSPLGSEDDHLFCVEDAEISAIIVDPRFGARANDLQIRASKLRVVFALGGAPDAIDLSAKASAGRQMAEDRAQSNDIAMIAYTGGTTGRPKGVVHTHASALAALHMAASEWEWPINGKVLAVTPVSHAAGILAYPTFLRGGAGGSSGAGGGVVMVVARYIAVSSGTAYISAPGTPGSGGGGGGVVLIISSETSLNASVSTDVTGGTGCAAGTVYYMQVA